MFNWCKIRHKLADGSYSEPYIVYTEKSFEYGEIWRNLRGGWCSKYGTEIVESGIFTGSKEQFVDLNRKEIYADLRNDSSEFGWLSPHCEWYGCKYTEHSDLAEYYFGTTEEEMEQSGWIKVFKDFGTNKPAWCSLNSTNEQREWLNDHGIKPSKYGF